MSEMKLDQPTDPAKDGMRIDEKHHSRGYGKVILDFLNPAYHIRRMKEDFQVTKAALQKRQELLSGQATTADLPEIFRGKLMGVFFATGWTNLVGIGMGYMAQKMFSNAWVGLLSTPILCFIMTAIGFQAGWWLDNRRIYRAYKSDPAHQFAELQKDMWPVHRTALPMAVMFNFANVLFAAPILALLTWLAPEFAREAPAGLLIMIGEFLFIAGSFVRVMGDFFDRHGYELAIKYRSVCACDQSDAV